MWKLCLLWAVWLTSPMVFAHVVLLEPAALAGQSYRAALRVAHGCEGAPTTALQVMLPPGFRGAKPMPKPGWTLSVQSTPLAQAYDDHGRRVTEDVSSITWSASTPAHWLPDAYYDEFVLRGSLPAQAGPLWFKVIQTCSRGRNDWVEVPPSGSSTRGLKSPAALLDVIESDAAGHQH